MIQSTHNQIKILCISDTHSKHKLNKNLPAADILIHAGDITLSGLDTEINEFADWLDSLTQFTHKIVNRIKNFPPHLFRSSEATMISPWMRTSTKATYVDGSTLT